MGSARAPERISIRELGSKIKGLLTDDLANIKLPLPPLHEQRRIADILSAVDSKLELERRRKEKHTELEKNKIEMIINKPV
jgi:type I restriction enzyme S subunit